MTASVAQIAAALRARQPGLPQVKLHKLLYLGQGHHLATFGRPLFGEPVSAWDKGPVIGQFWKEEKERVGPPADTSELSEAELNTVGYVLSRYGALTGTDLIILTHGQEPWQRADQHRQAGGSVRIEPEWMREYFGADQAEDDELGLDPDEVTDWLRDAPARRASAPGRPDDLDELRRRLRTGA